ncbi:MAG: DNA topoisomerase IB [Chloroflexota bacterium]|nr:DNA topoisomerase IB [Chloroflexota bacterium]
MNDDALLAARAARLRYVNDGDPGITRRRQGRGFSYREPNGQLVRDPATLARIRSLAIPPAWRDVWICPSPRGHVQATGRDARGRKQYRYHPLWRQVRDEAKYERVIGFAEALPKLRERVAADMSRPGLPREKVIGTIVQLLEFTLLRVGNEEYARQNRSFGLTTLRDRHARIGGTSVQLSFRGKGGKMVRVGLRNRRLARIVRQCQELPGQRLFQYVDQEGTPQAIDSDDVNAYLREAMGDDYSAKDFRTWAATVLAARALRELGELGEEESKVPTRRRVASAVAEVAGTLGNTPAICRSSYIHPQIIDAYVDGTLAAVLVQRAEQELSAEGNGSLDQDERWVLSFLRDRLAASTGTSTGMSSQGATRSANSAVSAKA